MAANGRHHYYISVTFNHQPVIWQLTLLSLVPVPFVVMGSRTFGKKIRPFYRRIWRRWSAVTGILTDTIPGIRVIKAFANEKRSVDTFQRYNNEWLKTDIKASRITTLFPNIVGFVVTCGSLLIWGVGDYYTIKNYEHAGRSNPMSAALSAAMDRLLDSSLLEFHFDPIEDEPDNQSVYVLVHGKLDPNELAEIEDSISSYLESMSEYGFEKMVENVMKVHRTVSYRIIQPDYTFHV